MLQIIKPYLGKCFAMKDLREAAFILGIKIYRDRSKRLIGLSQSAYMDKIYDRFRMDISKRGNILMQERFDLNKTQRASTHEEVKHMQNVLYASTVGSIMLEMQVGLASVDNPSCCSLSYPKQVSNVITKDGKNIFEAIKQSGVIYTVERYGIGEAAKTYNVDKPQVNEFVLKAKQDHQDMIKRPQDAIASLQKCIQEEEKEPKSSGISSNSEGGDVLCYICGKNGHKAKECCGIGCNVCGKVRHNGLGCNEDRFRDGRVGTNGAICYYCGKAGYIAVCSKCGQTGHVGKECEEEKNGDGCSERSKKDLILELSDDEEGLGADLSGIFDSEERKRFYKVLFADKGP
uniref:Putative retrotransposon protein n=1 Tax=Tanacetum cinerariifolium TaxID=118510 RepID=A0A6L2JBC6_TANCI|nr:putative retrotransposon protein [Tanacetum cinerariifolium]